MSRLVNLGILTIFATVAFVALAAESQHPHIVLQHSATTSAETDNTNVNPTPSSVASISAEIKGQEYTPPSPSKRSFAYCVELRDVDESYRSELTTKLAATYADPRGWSLGEKLTFTHVESGCDYTVVLAAAADMPSFSPVCSIYWSCRAGRYVIFNFDRWTGSSDTWSGQPLSEYQSLVINHETGHWLGFDHLHCPAAGALAPVMQQQSISLEGCLPNAWPLPSELQSLANRYGIKL